MYAQVHLHACLKVKWRVMKENKQLLTFLRHYCMNKKKTNETGCRNTYKQIYILILRHEVMHDFHNININGQSIPQS